MHIITRFKWGHLPLFLNLLIFFTINILSLCLQWLKISCLLLRVAFSGWKRIFHFSAVQRLHVLDMGENGAALHTTSQFSWNSVPLSLSCHTCPASVVFVRPSGLARSCLCFENLSLNVFAVRPTYFSSELLVVTVALYTTLSVVHLPGRGQFVGSLQLHNKCSILYMCSR